MRWWTWWGIRHVRWLCLAWAFARWWRTVGRYVWLVPNPNDALYLNAVWRGEV